MYSPRRSLHTLRRARHGRRFLCRKTYTLQNEDLKLLETGLDKGGRPWFVTNDSTLPTASYMYPILCREPRATEAICACSLDCGSVPRAAPTYDGLQPQYEFGIRIDC